MKLDDYRKTLTKKLGIRTLVLFIDEDMEKILLGYKKRGFGKGNRNGIGGKVEPGETIREAAIRECMEEVSLKPLQLEPVADIDFFFPTKQDAEEQWNQRVVCFLCTSWEGKAVESDEIRPEWYDINSIPYDDMWDDDRYWLPHILDKKKLKLAFSFDDENKVAEFYCEVSGELTFSSQGLYHSCVLGEASQ